MTTKEKINIGNDDILSNYQLIFGLHYIKTEKGIELEIPTIKQMKRRLKMYDPERAVQEQYERIDKMWEEAEDVVYNYSLYDVFEELNTITEQEQVLVLVEALDLECGDRVNSKTTINDVLDCANLSEYQALQKVIAFYEDYLVERALGAL